MRDFLGKFLRVLFMMFISSTLLLGSCEDEDSIEDNEDQRDDIASFLESSSHNPALISESDLSTTLEIDPPFYTRYGNYAFRYIETYYDAGRDSQTLISSGSRVTLTFRLYEFTGSAISDSTLPVYTNDGSYLDDYEAAGLNTTYWTFQPIVITIGQSDELSSIHTGLTGCRNGDIVELYLTRNMAYGDEVVGLVDQWSSLAFFCEITEVE